MPTELSAEASSEYERLSCVTCRTRKLKCDKTKGTCNRCVKADVQCEYPESRRKPTFRRHNVKELEARLAQVEGILGEATKSNGDGIVTDQETSWPADVDAIPGDFCIAQEPVHGNGAQDDPENESQIPGTYPAFQDPDAFTFTEGQLMALGISESLPPFEVIEELTNIYFQNSHHLLPILHPGRYYQAFYGSAVRKPATCLQYIIIASAAHMHATYKPYADVFYRRARQYADADEMKGVGEHFITLEHVQFWAIMSGYEARNLLFTRAAISTARAIRLANMMGLDRLDDPELDLPPAIPPATCWVEMEERRRIFWGVFTCDAHASISTGWPSLIKTEDIMTRLPASEEAFLAGKEAKSPFIDEALNGADYAGFAGTIIICHIFKVILKHTHRPKPSDHPEDLINGQFWKTHRDIDNKLSSLFLFLPEKFHLPKHVKEPVATHTNLNIHAAVICLHHAAVDMAEKYNLAESVKEQSASRLRASAEEVVNIVKMSAHTKSIFRSPLCALSMYCAMTVYMRKATCQDTPGLDPIDISNVDILIRALEAMSRVHDVSKSFLRQAYRDVTSNNIQSHIRVPDMSHVGNSFVGTCGDIPLLARSALSLHSGLRPVLPGKLPLSTGSTSQTRGPTINDTQTNFGMALPRHGHVQPTPVCTPGPVATGEVAPSQSHKRRRTSHGSVADTVFNQSQQNKQSGPPGRGQPDMQKQYSKMAPALAAVGIWRTGGMVESAMSISSNGFEIPDRTGSSPDSSSLNPGTGTETHSSSAPSPGPGLGNTMQENRLDLRQLHGRISSPIWQSSGDDMLDELSRSTTNDLMSGDGEDTWRFLTGEVDWDVMGSVPVDIEGGHGIGAEALERDGIAN